MKTLPHATGDRTVTHDDLRRRQEDLLRHLLDLLAGDRHVLGLVAGGSYARGRNDGFSDLDLHCYLRDQERTGRDELHERVSALAPTLSVLYLYDLHGLYLYEDGVRLDLDYFQASAVHTNARHGIQILLDPDGVLARDLGSAHVPALPTHPRYWEAGNPAYVTWFLWMFRQIYCWTKRGAQAGERALSKLASAADSLHQTRTSLTQMRLWTLDRTHNLARADSGLATALIQTYPHLVPDELLAATRHLLAAYEQVCPDYCAKTGIAYPTAKVQALHHLLDEFDLLR